MYKKFKYSLWTRALFLFLRRRVFMLYSVLELWSFNIFRTLMHIAWTMCI
jgi:hypothetical protein